MSFQTLMAAFRSGVGGPNPMAPVPPAAIPVAQAPAGQTANSEGTAPNGVVPGNGAVGNVQAPKNPLDSFAELWAPPKPVEGATGPTPLFNNDPAKLLEMARKQDFRPQVSQEQLALITKGGPEAFNVMMEIMNDMAQKAYATGAHATTQLISGALDKSQFVKAAEIDTHMKRSKVSETLKADNPLFTNPAVAPMIKGLEQQLLLKHPDATSAEIANMAREYLGGVVEMFQAPEKEKKQKEAKAGEEDWSNFFS